MEIIEFATEDIITTSGDVEDFDIPANKIIDVV